MLKLCNIVSKQAQVKNAFVDWTAITNENISPITMNMNIHYTFTILTSILKMYTIKSVKYLFEISLTNVVTCWTSNAMEN